MRDFLNAVGLIVLVLATGVIMGFWLGLIGGIAMRVARGVM